MDWMFANHRTGTARGAADVAKKLMVLFAGAVLSAGLAGANPIIGLYNSGVDAGGGLLVGGPGTLDPHWTVLGGGAAAVAPDQRGFYLPQNTALWINTDGQGVQSTLFTLQLQFDLTGFDHTTASFGGRFAADNCAVMRLNGALADSGGTVGPCGALTAFGQYTSFSFISGFVAGLNTITVEVTNEQGSPGAMLVEFTASDVQPLTGAAVPEPGTWGLTVGALTVLAVLRRKRG